VQYFFTQIAKFPFSLYIFNKGGNSATSDTRER